jgi:hypothetical protein
MSSGNELLMQGGGTPWAKFPTIGTVVIGTVLTEPVVQQQRDFEDNSKLLTWDNGDPKREFVAKIQTAERDPAIEDDDGIRALHMASPNMISAVRAACKAVKSGGLEVGGVITITYTGDGEAKGRGKAPKMYTASYERPPNAGNASLMGEPTSAASSADDDDPGPPKPEQIAAGKWAEMSIEQRRSVVAALGSLVSSGIPVEQPAF